MCGIFGVIVKPSADCTYESLTGTLDKLYQLSESRGKESAGLHAYLPGNSTAWTLKGAIPASEFIRSNEYNQFKRELKESAFPDGGDKPSMPVVLLAHSRLVTNGAAEEHKNNQPVRYSNVSMVHNGIVVNVDDLWKQNPQLTRNAEVDTEVIAALLSNTTSTSGQHPINATKSSFEQIKGAASIGWVSDTAKEVVLATNTGDLYYSTDADTSLVVFASEQFFLEQALIKQKGSLTELANNIEWIKPQTGRYIDLCSNELVAFELNSEYEDIPSQVESVGGCEHKEMAVGSYSPMLNLAEADESLIRYSESSILSLKRCSRCILPETFPYISFDSEGVCSYCRSYRPRYLGLDPEKAKKDFIASVQKYRGDGKTPDVIVPFSGGRDSCYGLHLIKKEFGLTPTTFTYDWGMVTDLARRNTARLCGKLGVQNILVSADIKAKRENIRKMFQPGYIDQNWGWCLYLWLGINTFLVWSTKSKGKRA